MPESAYCRTADVSRRSYSVSVPVLRVVGVQAKEVVGVPVQKVVDVLGFQGALAALFQMLSSGQAWPSSTRRSAPLA